ncbi:amidohydrolase family protein [Kineosporia babensis]|uniref:Amidohydrolase family protein n=1 Tax=Kineosporia babensis TaxID=499548 RepID=A0A9X1SWJ1_9ACTN|nr:amidohydrolase family protein [Kineosporia babensis]MCD5314799.1 amidohydrolase family protein [Kineosporia babensis]
MSTSADGFGNAPAVVFRGGTVLTMDDRRTVLTDADVLVVADRIEALGPGLPVPEGTLEVDAGGGIVMPGMIDTHRHMWQTAMRGYGADWTLTQYFVWNYLEHGKKFRPQDIYAGNLLSGLEALEAGVTTSVDWSHNLQTIEHAEAAVDALEEVPGRFVLAYGNIQAAPWEWAATSEFRSFVERRMPRTDLLGFQMAFDVTGDPAFPERAAFEVARDLDVAVSTHAGVWGATNDNGIRLMHEHGFMRPETIYVHAATLSEDSYQRIAASGASASVAAESEATCGQGFPSSWALRRHGIPISLSMDTSVWMSADLFTAMRQTLAADHTREHHEAHALGNTVTHLPVRAGDVLEWATRGGARALGLDGKVGSLEVGKQADVVLIKNDDSPVMFPLLNPFGHVVLQAQRGDVHTVMVNGRVVKHAHRLVGNTLGRARQAIEETITHLRGQLGESAWAAGMSPQIPESKVLDNPYTYTDFADSSTHQN